MNGGSEASQDVTTADFRLTPARPGFKWAGEERPGFRFLQWPSGALCDPAVLYFGHLCENGQGRPGTLKDVAYILRLWFVFLWNKSVPWNSATDEHLWLWRQEHRDARRAARGAKPGPKPSREEDGITVRCERRLSIVFDFYASMPMVFCRHERILAMLPRVAPAGVATRDITSETIEGSAGGRIAWANREPGERSSCQRPTPTSRDALRVSTHLRTGRDHGDETCIVAERNWLMSECMRRAACRCCEVASLTLEDIWAALRDLGLVKRLSESVSMTVDGIVRLGPDDPGTHALDYVAERRELRQELLSAIERERRRGNPTIMIRVAGKRDARQASFPIDLVVNLLEVGVWECRRQLIKSFRAASAYYAAPAEVFLSEKTGKALQPGSIGGIVRGAFKETNVRGSAHRLRARAGIDNEVERRVRDNESGIRTLTSTPDERDLEAMREFYGHKRISDSLKNYARLAVIETEALLATPLAKNRRSIIKALDEMSSAEIEELRRYLLAK